MNARLLRLAALAILLLLVATSTRAQNTVALKPSVRLARDAAEHALVLHQIATIDGPDAQRLGAIVIESTPVRASRPIAGGRELELAGEAVRRTLHETPGINPGRVSFSGSSCRVVFRDQAVQTESQGPSATNPAATPDDGSPTVRTVIRGVIAARAGVPEVDLKLEFLPENEAVLAIRQRGPSGAGLRTIEAKPIGWGDRVPIAVTVYEMDRVIAQETVRVAVKIRRDVATATHDLRRGLVIGENDVAREEQWLDAGDEPADAAGVVGWGVRSRIPAGRVLMRADLEPPVAVKKGELVRIDCVSGTLVVRTKGRALSSGKVGEVIRFASPRDKTQIFEARLSARGQAVLVASTTLPSLATNSTQVDEDSSAPTTRLTGEAALAAAFERLTK